ncbi:MAG TPA: hypothetical protein VE442_19655 [Jatrophihabitans sp.]|nr:hypothetical protein [Jatrophihabitans sp.]
MTTASALRRLPLAVTAAALLAACTSSGSAGASGTAPVPSGMPTAVAKLSTFISSAAQRVTSAHLHVGIKLSAEQLSGRGAERLSDGEVVALDLTANLAGAGDIHVVYVNGTTYATLPASMDSSGKYLIVTSDSPNPVIHQLAPYLGAALAAVSPGRLGAIARAAPSVDVQGTRSVAGVQATHYSLEVDPTKLPSDLQDALPVSGQPLPLDLYVARDGKLVEASLHLNVQGQDIPIDVKFSDYNAPVSITPPTPGQIGH